MPLPGLQHGEAAGWVGRTHDHQHIMRVACGLDNTRGVEEFVEDRLPEEEKTQDRQHMHSYDLDHIDLGVCNGRAVKHGSQDTHPTFSKLHSG